MSGRLVHFEIPFEDSERARSFYSEAFGWDMNHLPEMNYTLVSTGPSGEQGPTEPGFINGGMMSRDDSPTPGPILVVDVDDIDAALTKIGELGGETVSGRVSVGDMGWSAYFKDPEGNLMGLWQSAPQG
ncbi:MAG TPA: VOC family protein [Acidimicrobiia bacterium]|jgi:predicted enzyme related to lactoylglutathione lyase|nr:VOC family protein [Acidimicrobiia bacterium]